jgi:2-polyprenyl-3-methyl-5-hydroxy-6-metoxy-1,4-benzoquinol methylase
MESKERDSKYYDERFEKSMHYSLDVDADHSCHSDLYNFVIKLFAKEDKILELGCGTGQFANKIIDSGFNYKVGIDFSKIGIKMCHKRCPDNIFLCRDLNIISFNRFNYNTILSLETIEHIEGDFDILQRIKPGTKVIISVSSFDVLKRYSCIFSTIKVHTINRYYVIEAIK